MKDEMQWGRAACTCKGVFTPNNDWRGSIWKVFICQKRDAPMDLPWNLYVVKRVMLWIIPMTKPFGIAQFIGNGRVQRHNPLFSRMVA